MAENNNSWELNTINKMLEMSITEQRARRRWGIFFKLIILAYILFFTFKYIMQEPSVSLPVGKGVTAMVVLDGIIASDSDASADNIIPLLRKAFANPSAKGVILRINSPGGSPVQSNLIYKEMLDLRQQYPEKKLYAVIEDLGASGAYWVACGADYIVADESSIVGSIGAAISSFGFVDAMQKYGVQRRLYTSGSNKGMLDPFSPTTPGQLAIINKEMGLLLKMFSDVVKQNRGDRLHLTEDMFSGRFWLGVEAQPLGLIDELGCITDVAAQIGAPDIVEYTPKSSIFSELTKQMGQSMAKLAHTCAGWL